jgi:hypothetical protein
MSEFIIPNHLIFVWLGKNFPWSLQWAMESAYKQCKPDKVTLVWSGTANDVVNGFLNKFSFSIRSIEVSADYFKDVIHGDKLWQVYQKLQQPAAKSNILRLVALWKEGGIYLDGDTVTIKDLSPLREYKGFCGVEPVALPYTLYQSKNPISWFMAGIRLGFRELCARSSHGVRWFRIVESLYISAANNAVLGACAGNGGKGVVCYCYSS